MGSGASISPASACIFLFRTISSPLFIGRFGRVYVSSQSLVFRFEVVSAGMGVRSPVWLIGVGIE